MSMSIKFEKIDKEIYKLQTKLNSYNKALVAGKKMKDYFESDFDEAAFLITDQRGLQIWVEAVPEWASYQLEFDDIRTDISFLVDEYYSEINAKKPKDAFKVPLKVVITGYDFQNMSTTKFETVEALKRYLEM